MKTVIVLYMPGHAGNFVARLFSLGPETMPLIRKSMMMECIEHGTEIPDSFDRLANYEFSKVWTEFNTWQAFHRAFADHKEFVHYRLLNAFCNQKYSRIVFPLHPHEFSIDFSSDADTELYYVDLDLDHWGHWTRAAQEKLQFRIRPLEEQQFHEFKRDNNMKPIYLSQLLKDEHSFIQEYRRVCTEMQIPVLVEQALILRKDWYSTRVEQL